MTRYWFISTKYRRNSKLALLTFLLALIVIILGAYTRLTDAGLSCPDWPHCFGYLTAPHTPAQLKDAAVRFPETAINITKAWTEMTHRYFAGTEGILLLVFAFSLLFTRKRVDLKSTFISIALIALLCIQVFLGMLTVTAKLHPYIVVAHLITGLSILSILWWAYLDLHMHVDSFMNKSNPSYIPWLWIGFIILAGQISLGGWVSAHYAGLACIDFPYCNGKIFPAMHWSDFNKDLITIHMAHRIGALVTLLYLSLLAIFMLANKSFQSIAVLIFTLLTLQASLGILNIIYFRPVFIALLHHVIAIFLLLTLITALVKAYVESTEFRHAAWLK